MLMSSVLISLVWLHSSLVLSVSSLGVLLIFTASVICLSRAVSLYFVIIILYCGCGSFGSLSQCACDVCLHSTNTHMCVGVDECSCCVKEMRCSNNFMTRVRELSRQSWVLRFQFEVIWMNNQSPSASSLLNHPGVLSPTFAHWIWWRTGGHLN